MATVNLIYNGKKTNAYWKLRQCNSEGGTTGATVERRSGGFSDYGILCDLKKAGFVEIKPLGPRGGDRWIITEAGRQALKAANEQS